MCTTVNNLQQRDCMQKKKKTRLFEWYAPSSKFSHAFYRLIIMRSFHFFHISHNLTWNSAIVHKFTRSYPVWSTYELTKHFMYLNLFKECAIDLKKNNLCFFFLPFLMLLATKWCCDVNFPLSLKVHKIELQRKN